MPEEKSSLIDHGNNIDSVTVLVNNVLRRNQMTFTTVKSKPVEPDPSELTGGSRQELVATFCRSVYGAIEDIGSQASSVWTDDGLSPNGFVARIVKCINDQKDK